MIRLQMIRRHIGNVGPLIVLAMALGGWAMSDAQDARAHDDPAKAQQNAPAAVEQEAPPVVENNRPPVVDKNTAQEPDQHGQAENPAQNPGRPGLGPPPGRGPGRGRGFGGGFGPGRGRGGPGGDERFQADRDLFHELLGNHKKIERKVTKRADGVETLTESADPLVAAQIQEHVLWMHERIKKVHPIRMRDPLFAELFRNADKIEMKVENTPRGVKVIETSRDPRVAELIKAHADVVSLFVANGFDEAHKNHAVPPVAAPGKGN